jgi:hypothetical protein
MEHITSDLGNILAEKNECQTVSPSKQPHNKSRNGKLGKVTDLPLSPQFGVRNKYSRVVTSKP